MKFYMCEICGKIITQIEETAVDTVCCGEPMRELVPDIADGDVEKHVPEVRVDGHTVVVTVGSTPHPMLKTHFIQWIVLQTQTGCQYRRLQPGDAPQATFALIPQDTVKAVYAYCSVHGLWKSFA